MGVIIPQVITEDKAGGAQIIDGGLRFDSSKSQYLTRTPGSAGNTLTWTFSCWLKRNSLSATHYIIRNSSVDEGFYFNSNSNFIDIYRYSGSFTYYATSPGVFRDISSWYHIVYVHDATQSTGSRLRLYVNGVLQNPLGNLTDLASNTGYSFNTASAHRLGEINGQMSNVYLIDGQALDASYFGYTDPLTNTWRPKKYTGNFNYSAPTGTLTSTQTALPTYSNQGGGSENSSYPVSNGFDGSASTYCDMTYLNGQWSKLTFGTAITGVTSLVVGYDGEGDIGYNGSVVNSSVGYTGSRQTITLYSGSAITLTDLYFVSQAGNGVCRLYDVTINGVEQTFVAGTGTNSFYLPFDGSAPIGQDQSGRGNNWTPVNFGGSNTIEKATGALPILNTDGGGKVARVGVRTDSNASSLVLALPLVGIKSDFSNAVNSGTSNKAITANGNAAASNAQSNFYGGSFAFDGTGDYLRIPSLNLGSSWTYEAWVYPTTSNVIGLFDTGTGLASVLRNYPNNTIEHQNGSRQTFSMPTNAWSHIAVCFYTSGNLKFDVFINGVLNGTTDCGTSSYVQGTYFDIGVINSGADGNFAGYLQDVRVYNGVRKYTQNFIPASTDPDILPDTPSGVAYSSTLSLPTSNEGGSLMFDGSGDYLRFSQSSDWAFDQGDFSIEYFIFPNYTTDTLGFGGTRGASGTSAGWNIGLINEDTAGGYIQMYSNGGIAPTNAYCKIPYRKWTHVVYTRSGSTIRAIIDGVLYNTASNSQNWTLNDFSIGITGEGAAEPYLGFLSNIRIIKGSIPTSYQTSSTTLGTKIFDVPTSPLTISSQGANATYVKFLGCNSLTAITDFTVTPNTPTVNGNVSVSNFNPFTVNINTQRGQESGYATLDPLKNLSAITLSNGNLDLAFGSATNGHCSSTVGVSTGRWYWEYLETAGSSLLGISNTSLLTTQYPGQTSTTYSYFGRDSQKVNNGSFVSYGQSFTVGDTIGVAFDATGGTLSFYKNGVNLGVAFSGISNDTYFPAFSRGADTPAGKVNFGQKPFKFPPPAGFQPLALANTPRPTIVRPDQYVGVTTFTGTGQGTTTTVSNLQFKPDFVWTKSRTGGRNYGLYDSVRGINRKLYSSADFAENTGTTLTSFDRNGFKLADGDDIVYYGESGVAWCWKAGGNSNTFNINDVGYATASTAGLTAGTITPSGISVNTKSGFSIVTYNSGSTTGNFTVDHGLNAVPKFIIHKNRASGNWWVYHASVIDDLAKYLQLNSTNAIATNSANMWGGAFPTSSVFGVRVGDLISTSQNTIAYLWAEIPGFSKFGKFTGNASDDGPTVVLGFRPALIIWKCVDTSSAWTIEDRERSKYNPADARLFLDDGTVGGVETSNGNGKCDFLSNGFKIRTSHGGINVASTVVYAAWAEAPSFNLYGGQANAR